MFLPFRQENKRETLAWHIYKEGRWTPTHYRTAKSARDQYSTRTVRRALYAAPHEERAIIFVYQMHLTSSFSQSFSDYFFLLLLLLLNFASCFKSSRERFETSRSRFNLRFAPWTGPLLRRDLPHLQRARPALLRMLARPEHVASRDAGVVALVVGFEADHAGAVIVNRGSGGSGGGDSSSSRGRRKGPRPLRLKILLRRIISL